MKRNSTMFVSKKFFPDFQSSFLQSIEKSFESRYANQLPSEKNRLFVVQYACAFEIHASNGMGNIDTFVN